MVVALEKLVYDLSRCAERKLDIKILSLSRASRITSLATPTREVVSLKRLISAYDPKRTLAALAASHFQCASLTRYDA